MKKRRLKPEKGRLESEKCEQRNLKYGWEENPLPAKRSYFVRKTGGNV